MDTFLVLSAVIAATTVLSECSSIKRTSEPVVLPLLPPGWEDTCETDLYRNCLYPNHLEQFEHTLSTEKGVMAFLSDRPTIEFFASRFQAASECVDIKMAQPLCDGVDLEDIPYSVIKLVADYLSYPGHIDIVVQLPSSPCVTNFSSKEEELVNAFTSCYVAFLQHLTARNDTCEGMDNLATCVVSAMSSVCGTAVGDFAQSFWDYIQHPDVHIPLFSLMENPFAASLLTECHHQTSLFQGFAKRALKALRK